VMKMDVHGKTASFGPIWKVAIASMAVPVLHVVTLPSVARARRESEFCIFAGPRALRARLTAVDRRLNAP